MCIIFMKAFVYNNLAIQFRGYSDETEMCIGLFLLLFVILIVCVFFKLLEAKLKVYLT